jgi:hypothetical protein
MRQFIDYWVMGKTDVWSDICARHLGSLDGEGDCSSSARAAQPPSSTDESPPEFTGDHIDMDTTLAPNMKNDGEDE